MTSLPSFSRREDAYTAARLQADLLAPLICRMQSHPLDVKDVLRNLPSLNDLRTTLEAVAFSPFPPRSVFIRATTNQYLLQELLQNTFDELNHRNTWYSITDDDMGIEDADGDREPLVSTLLPRAVIIDCAELASTKALFARILNTLSGWGHGEWNDALGGVLNWDGRQDGYSITKEQSDQQSHHSRGWQIKWDYEAALDARTNSDASRPAIVDRKDESMSAFLQGMRMIFTLGRENPNSNSGENGVDATADTDLPIPPRFVVLLNAEKLFSLETNIPSQQDGSLLAAFMRIGELTGQPVIPILTSCSEWLLLRPSKGATEPAVMLDMPALRRQDLAKYLHATILPELSGSSNLTAEQQSNLLAALIDLTQQTFEPYIGNEIADYLWLIEKLWPEWVRPVTSGAVQAGDTNRLVALIKSTLSREIESLGELRPLVGAAYDQEKQDETLQSSNSTNPTIVSASSASNTIVNGKQQATHKKVSATAAFYANAPANASPLLPYSPSNAATPNRSNGVIVSHAASHSSYALTASLTLLARYILISAFLASSNPSRKDLLMLATQEDELLASKRKKKGGAIRKSPTKRGGGGGGGDADDNALVGPIRKKDTAVPQRLLGPRPFPLERLIAITETILPVELRNLAKSQDILQEIAHLTNLRLLLKTSSSASLSSYPNFATASSISPFDRLDGIKLKCSTTFELDLVEQIGKSVGFKVAERLWETFG